MRQLASRSFNLYVRTIMRLEVTDTQCAAKAVRAECLPELLGRLDTPGFAFDIDLISSGMVAGLVINEMPVLWTDQEGSTVSLRRAVPSMMKEVFRLRRKYGSMADGCAASGSTGRQFASISEPNHSEDGAVQFGDHAGAMETSHRGNGERPPPVSHSPTPMWTDPNVASPACPKMEHHQMPSSPLVRSVEPFHENGNNNFADGQLG